MSSYITFLTPHRLAQLVIDTGIAGLAFLCAYILRFDGQVPEVYLVQALVLLPAVIGLRLLLRTLCGIHHQLWRYVALQDALDIAISITLGTMAMVLTFQLALNEHVPWGVLAHDWWINLVGLVAVRVLRRLHTERSGGRRLQLAHTRVLLIGAGQAGNVVVREILQASRSIFPVGFVDDDRTKFRSRVQGIEVLGRTDDIPRLVSAYEIDEVIMCVPSAKEADRRRILDLCNQTKVKIKTVPALQDLISGKVGVAKFRDIEIEDLLNRDPVDREFDRVAAASYLEGRVVMISGAGGSIGSELCRQIALLAPSRLVLVGRGEFSIYSIENELRSLFPALDLVPLIADVRDVGRMRRIFERYTPDAVFHAAAHKHVPLMEKNPSEAVWNNIFGTRIIAELADQFNAETFVLISSDKAVNPTNVMGATKRVAEIVVQELATRSQTRFMSVRFGNVLGSRGSVIPLFKQQIAMGGPITITHPDIIRYFMTIPEAAQLVLQAGAVGKGGEVFVLDMGEPVKIVDLARDLIKLTGLQPDVDIKIKFTGLRPGEKLFEELLTAEEGTSSTSFRKIFTARPEPVNRQRMELALTMLQSAATIGDDMGIRRGLKSLVESYRYQRPEQEGISEAERADATSTDGGTDGLKP